jgi:hypothetical protein
MKTLKWGGLRCLSGSSTFLSHGFPQRFLNGPRRVDQILDKTLVQVGFAFIFSHVTCLMTLGQDPPDCGRKLKRMGD